MEIKAIFGILASVVLIIGGVPYLIDIHKKKVHPHILSWLGWSFITALGGSAMLASGSQWVVALLFANTFLCFGIAGYSIVRKVGVWSTSIYDFLFFGLGILGLILWQVTGSPIIALVLAIVADLSFGLPTIIKTYKNPESETYFAWLASTVSGLLSLFAIENFNFSEVAYPAYLFTFDMIVLFLVLKVIRKKENTILNAMEEYLDIVDENNNITREKKLRSLIHKDGSWHRTVHIYYFMKKNNEYYFLVHLRSKEKDLCPNMWDTRFGGHLKSGQDVKQTLISELEEEIGLKADINNFISGPVTKREDFPNNEFTYVYYYQGLEDINSLKFVDNEVQEVKWLSAQDIIKEIKNNSNDWAPSLDGFESIYKYLIDFQNSK